MSYFFKHWGVFIGFENKKAYIAHTGTDFGDFGNCIGNSSDSLITIKTKMAHRHQIQVKAFIIIHSVWIRTMSVHVEVRGVLFFLRLTKE